MNEVWFDDKHIIYPNQFLNELKEKLNFIDSSQKDSHECVNIIGFETELIHNNIKYIESKDDYYTVI